LDLSCGESWASCVNWPKKMTMIVVTHEMQFAATCRPRGLLRRRRVAESGTRSKSSPPPTGTDARVLRRARRTKARGCVTSTAQRAEPEATHPRPHGQHGTSRETVPHTQAETNCGGKTFVPKTAPTRFTRRSAAKCADIRELGGRMPENLPTRKALGCGRLRKKRLKTEQKRGLQPPQPVNPRNPEVLPALH